MTPILCMTDTKGRTVWVAQSRRDFDPYLPSFRERGERYRIVERSMFALGGSTAVYVLVLTGGGR